MMIYSGMFNYVDVLTKASNASMTRQEVISNNIANVDTPNYKRKDVTFEATLSSLLKDANSLNDAVEKINRNTDVINASIYTDNTNLSYRLDGNNVDIDTENAYLAENQIRYYTLLQSITSEFSRFQTVIK